MRCLAIICVIVAFGTSCTLLGLGQKKTKTSADRLAQAEREAQKEADAAHAIEVEEPIDPNDEEAGVRAINKSLRRFSKSLQAREFEKATKYMRRAIKQVRKASSITRSHPDFEDMEETVVCAQRRLEVAIETDRIERRNAAIDDLIQRGQAAMAQAGKVYVELVQRVPSEEDIAKLDDLLAAFDVLRGEGSNFLDDDRYAAYAVERDEQAASLRQLHAEARWQVDAAETVAGVVEIGYQAGLEGRDADELEEEIRSFHQSGLAFQNCVSTITDLKRDELYDGVRPIATRFGSLPISETKKRCAALAKRAQGRVTQLTWRRSVKDVVLVVNTALARVRQAKDARKILQHSRAAADALSKCMLKLEKVQSQPGFDREMVFETLLGSVAAVVLATNCDTERQRIVKQLPTLKWQTTLIGLRDRIKRTKKMIDSAAAAKKPKRAVTLWEEATDALKACAAQARQLSRKRGASRTHPIETAFGSLTIGAIEKRCNHEKAAAKKNLNEAMKRQEIELYAATTAADERDVVRTEGIPTRIDRVRGGRIFVYEKPGKRGDTVLRRFGFDTMGKRYDFWIEWRKEAVGVVSDLARVLTAVRAAKSAVETLVAIDEATPVLGECQTKLEASKKNAGYDPQMALKTPMGTLTTDKLIVACAKEKKRFEAMHGTTRWLAQLERLADRINEAQGALTAAEKEKKPEARIRMLSSALGGLQECIERAEVLPKEEGADLKHKIASVYGNLNVAGIKQACKTMLGEARVAADAALVAIAAAKFMREECRGDEVEVARREGVPKQIVNIGEGRVFVYEIVGKDKKKTTKRIAFDTQGKRIDEKILRAEVIARPEIREMQADGDELVIPDLE